MSFSSGKFCSPEDIEKRNSETTNEKEQMQKYEKKILQYILAEKIIPMDLKYWSFFHLLKPEFISQIHMVVIYAKCDNYKGAVIVTKDKNVYNLDCNKDYRSKTGDVHIAPYAKKIKELCGKNIQTFAHSWSFVLALTKEGELYIYEFTKRHGSYHEQPDVPTFTRIAGLNYKRIVDIACGSYHFLALTSHGEVYAWRDGNYMQDGNKNVAIFNGDVRQVKHKLKKKNVVHIACGHKFNMVITDENKLYGWGDNMNGQISFDRAQKYFKHPREITTFSENKIVKMVCGYDHTLALTNKGEIYAWGSNNEGQVGVNNNLKSSDPIVVNVPQMGKVLNVDAYGLMSVAVGYDRTIYVWGWYFWQKITQPCPTKFSRIFDVFVHSMWRRLNKPLIMHDSLHTVRITNNYNYKYTEEVLNIFESLEAAFDDPELEEFCFQFALRHMTAETLSKDYNKLDMSTQAKCTHRATIENDVTVTPSTFYSPNKNVEKKNLETTIKKKEMQKYEKRILQCVLAEKIIPIYLNRWSFFHVLKPEFIPQIHMVMVYDTYGNRVIIVTKDKNVYSLDYKEEYLKTGDTQIAPYLKEIKELCGKNIKTFAHRYSFILALTEEGEVYFSEIVKKLNSSRRTSDVFTFIRVADLSDKRIVDIGCGRDHDLALTSDGKVYEWGKENWEENYSKESDSEESDSQDGNENAAHFSVPWVQVKHELEKKKVVLIACGLTFNIVVTDENTIYGWGDNTGGQISIVRQQKYYKYPREIITISDKIVKVVCGYTHVLALTNKGEVYAWGDNSRGQVGVNKNGTSRPTVVNVPEMRKVLDIAAYSDMSVAVSYDKIIFVWGHFYEECPTPIPFPTKFSNIHDAFAHRLLMTMHNSLIVFTNNFNYVEEVLNTLEFLRAVFDDPLTSDLTIRVEGRPIYVHKAILRIRCQYFKNMFQHDWIENIQSISDSVYTVSDKFSYVVYKAFLKYLYTGIIDLPSENVLELMELADMYCETNLIKDCSAIIKKVITVSNVAFFYNKAIECNAKELDEFCFQFALRHMKAVVLSEEYIKLDTSTKDNFMRRAAKENTLRI